MDINKQILQKNVTISQSYREVLRRLNMNTSSNAYKKLYQRLEEWEIDTTHFRNKSQILKDIRKNGTIKKKTNEEIFKKESLVARATVKNRLLKDELKEYKCEMCRNTGEWMGKKVTLILDHINGVSNDHSIDNLRFLCPNCNATLDTHCIGAKGLKAKDIYKIDKRRLKRDRPELRKVKNRPSKEELSQMISEMSYVAIGKKYDISDNAVRKWAKKYEIIL